MPVAYVGFKLDAMYAPPVHVDVKLLVAGATPYDRVYLPMPDAEVMVVRIGLQSWEGATWHGGNTRCLHRAFYRTDSVGRVSAPMWWAEFGARVYSTSVRAYAPGHRNLEPEEARWANPGPNVIVLRRLVPGERVEARSEQFNEGKDGCEPPSQRPIVP